MGRIKIYWALYPLAVIYRMVTWIRNRFFDWGVLRSREFRVPTICVGNISVGGTGKTPHTEYLVRLLMPMFRVATLSRGYMRKTRGFVLADEGVTSEDIGDEPYQMMRKFPGLTVAVDGDRCRGISRIMDGVDVVLLDDAYQHRYVKAGVTILLIDYNRPIWDDVLLPAGRLRESASGIRRADIVIVSKCPKDMSEEEMSLFKGKIGCRSGQRVYFSTLLYNNMYRLSDGATRSLDSIGDDEEILLVTGIASPSGIRRELEKRSKRIKMISFPDHHDFTEGDMERIEKEYLGMNKGRRMIVTTEKDAARWSGSREMCRPVNGAYSNHDAISHGCRHGLGYVATPWLAGDREGRPYGFSTIGDGGGRMGAGPHPYRVSASKDRSRSGKGKECPYMEIYVLPIEVRFLNDEGEKFNQNIIEYVRENTRDGGVYKGADAHTS